MLLELIQDLGHYLDHTQTKMLLPSLILHTSLACPISPTYEYKSILAWILIFGSNFFLIKKLLIQVAGFENVALNLLDILHYKPSLELNIKYLLRFQMPAQSDIR